MLYSPVQPNDHHVEIKVNEEKIEDRSSSASKTKVMAMVLFFITALIFLIICAIKKQSCVPSVEYHNSTIIGYQTKPVDGGFVTYLLSNQSLVCDVIQYQDSMNNQFNNSLLLAAHNFPVGSMIQTVYAHGDMCYISDFQDCALQFIANRWILLPIAFVGIVAAVLLLRRK